MRPAELKYTYGGQTPVMRLHSGDVLETTTADADGHTIEEAGLKPGDTLAIHSNW